MDLITYALAKKYVNDTVDGLGAIKGASCTIESVTETDNSTEIVFLWTGTDETQQRETISIPYGKQGNSGVDGRGIESISFIASTGGDVSGILGATDVYQIKYTDGSTSSFSIVNGTQGTKGNQGIQGIQGEKGVQGEQGIQGIQGIQGEKGNDGYPFLIYKEYSDISEFNKTDFPEIGLMFMINDGTSANNKPVYRYTGDDEVPYSFITELATSEGIKGEKGDKGDKGEQGIQGEAGKDGTDGVTYTPSVGIVNTVDSDTNASVSVDIDDNLKQAVFNFQIPKGEKIKTDIALNLNSDNAISNKAVSMKFNEIELTIGDIESVLASVVEV